MGKITTNHLMKCIYFIMIFIFTEWQENRCDFLFKMEKNLRGHSTLLRIIKALSSFMAISNHANHFATCSDILDLKIRRCKCIFANGQNLMLCKADYCRKLPESMPHWSIKR